MEGTPGRKGQRLENAEHVSNVCQNITNQTVVVEDTAGVGGQGGLLDHG